MKVVIDTNLIMKIFQAKIDIIALMKRDIQESIELYILEHTINELRDLYNKLHGEDKINAKLSLEYIKKLIKEKNLNIITKEQIQKLLRLSDNKETTHLDLNYADDILFFLSQHGYIIATSDKELKKRIKNKIIFLHNKTIKFIS